MKRSNVVLLAAFLSLAAASVYRFAYSGAAGPRVDVSHLIQKRNVLKRDYSPSRALEGEDARPGRLVFALEEGVTLRGLAAAHMCPRDEHDGPSFVAAQSVVAMQTGDGLVLGSWVAERKPLGRGADWFLCFALWLDTPEGPEWRTGWAEVGIHDLVGTGVVVFPQVNERIRVEVATADGKPAPGAMVSVDDARYPPGRFFQYAFTGDDGTARISGLDADRHWRVALPDGLGPDKTVVSAIVSFPVRAPVVLASPLKGSWAYQRHFVRPPMRGGSFHVDAVQSPRGTLVALWSTAPWIGPGRGPWCPFYLMSREGLSLPPKVRLSFRGYSTVHVSTHEETRIVCRANSKDGEKPK